MALATSMLPAAMAACFAVYVATRRQWAMTLAALAGLALGLAPLAIYNAHQFGSPFVQANMAGNYTETFASFDAPRLLHHLNTYLGAGEVSVLKYMPIMALAVAGIALMPRRLFRQRLLLSGIIGLHLAWVLNLPAFGVCQYGPRWLMPMVPFTMLGLPALLSWPARRGPASAVALLAALAGTWSFIVNAVGALCGTMFCDTNRFAFLDYLQELPLLRLQLYPLAGLCLGLSAILAAGCALQAMSAGARRLAGR